MPTTQARFRGERPDLEEMIGNLVDNACKWAKSRVAIEVVRERPDPASASEVVRIVVDDDGRGLSPSEREQVAQRGRRLDETKPGSGLGLSIVVELASLYGGGLTLGTAPTRRLARRTGAAGGLTFAASDIGVRRILPQSSRLDRLIVASSLSAFGRVDFRGIAMSAVASSPPSPSSACRWPPAPAVRMGSGRARRKIPARCSAPAPARCSAPRSRAAAPAIVWPAPRLAACSAA